MHNASGEIPQGHSADTLGQCLKAGRNPASEEEPKEDGNQYRSDGDSRDGVAQNYDQCKGLAHRNFRQNGKLTFSIQR